MKDHLKELGRSVDEYGMAFIKNLRRKSLVLYDRETREDLPQDSDELRSAIGMTVKPKAKPMPKQPTLQDLTYALNCSPTRFIRPLNLTEKALDVVIKSKDLSVLRACDLFTQFSSLFKLCAVVHQFVQIAAPIGSVVEAMKFWQPRTLSIFFNGRIEFEICTSGLHFSGQQSEGFVQRRAHYFPARDAVPSGSIWKEVAEKSYIAAYYEALEDEDIDDEVMHKALDVLFDYTQVLPILTAPHQPLSASAKLWQNVDDPAKIAVKVITNPNFYAVDFRLPATSGSEPIKSKRRHQFCVSNRKLDKIMDIVRANSTHSKVVSDAMIAAKSTQRARAEALASAKASGKPPPHWPRPKVVTRTLPQAGDDDDEEEASSNTPPPVSGESAPRQCVCR